MSSTNPLMKLKVADLRGQLESRGLDSKGTKASLVGRLQEAMDADEKPDAKVETQENIEAPIISNLKKTIVEQTDSPAENRPGTPTRKSRRISGNFAEERPETPTRKSRRLSETITEDRPETPTRKSRRLSGNLTEDRPETPTRKSRRLSGGIEPTEDRPLTPSRKSRRLSGAGAGEDDKPDAVKSLLLEDQLAGLGSPSRRTSGTARNKRISQLGGAGITTIPEIPEKETITEATIVEEKEPEQDVPDKKAVTEAPKEAIPETPKEATQEASKEAIQEAPKEATQEVSKEAIPEAPKEEPLTKPNVVESNFTAIKEKKGEEKIVTDKPVQKPVVADKENQSMVKVLDNIIVAKQIPRQKPKSGKFWKSGREQFRQIKRDKGKKFTFEQRMKNKEEKRKNKELADLLMNRKHMKKEEARKKIEENKAKKAENEKKSEQFQVIKNPAKIKRMKKKQLRMLEKRDLVTV